MLAIYDDRDESIRLVMAGASEASIGRITIVVWGGNRTLQMEAYLAAQDIAAQGIPVAFIVGPERNGLEGDAEFDIYAKGGSVVEARYGMQNVGIVRERIKAFSLEAHRAFFIGT